MASPGDLPYTPTNILAAFTITCQASIPTRPLDTTRYFTDATISDLQKHGSTICTICHDKFGGLSAEDIQRIAPDEAATTSDTNAAADTDGDLQVCARPSKLPCGHVFGRECLKEWLDISDKCPMCRDEVSSMLCNDDDNDYGYEDYEDYEDYGIEVGYLLTLEDELDSDVEEHGLAHYLVSEAEDCACMWFGDDQGIPTRVIVCGSCMLAEEVALSEEDEDPECTCRWFLSEQGMPMRDGTCESCALSGSWDD